MTSETDKTLNDIRIVTLNKNIGLYNLKGDTDYSVFGMTGQKVLEGYTSLDTFIIEANTIASGVYIIELKDQKTNGVIRKKFVL